VKSGEYLHYYEKNARFAAAAVTDALRTLTGFEIVQID
jgi:hypothetical protein